MLPPESHRCLPMDDQPNTEFLFVYGSLRRQIKHPMSNFLQKNAEPVGEATFRGKLYDTGSYPAVLPSADPNDRVWGDLFALRNIETVFSKLDHYEGYDSVNPENSLFIRKKTSVQLENKKEAESWIYIYNRSVDRFNQIERGNYLTYLKLKDR